MSDAFDETQENMSQAAPRRRRKKLSKRQEFVRGLDSIYIVALILTLYMLVFRVVVVVGPSMYNTLIQGDRLLLMSSLIYNDPKQGDIVVCSKNDFDNGKCFVKRVIATEGQTVDIDFEEGVVYVDGQALQEDYTYTPTNVREGMQFPLIVEEGCIFVLGDNRQVSKDSRDPEIGLVDKREVMGKAIFLMMPGDHRGEETRDFDRIGVIK